MQQNNDSSPAVAEVQNNQTVLRVAAKIFNVKFTTLRRHILKEKDNPNTGMVPNYAVRLIFNKEQEVLLCDYLKCSEIAFGLSMFKLCSKIILSCQSAFL